MRLRDQVRLLRAALATSCQCSEAESGCHPTCWVTGKRIPHHCDCPMYVVELPPKAATAAYADALRRQAEILAGAT